MVRELPPGMTSQARSNSAADCAALLSLIGIPHRVVIGERSLKEGFVEYRARRATEAEPVAIADVVGRLSD